MRIEMQAKLIKQIMPFVEEKQKQKDVDSRINDKVSYIKGQIFQEINKVK